MTSARMRVNERIHLSEIRRADKAAYLELFRDKEIYDNTLTIPYPYTEKDADGWIALVSKRTAEQGRPVSWAIRGQDDLLIGGAGFDSLTIGRSHVTEIGYWLGKPHWGKGIMTDVVKRLCELAFSELGIVRITGHVFADNHASARVLEKAGFELEGVLRKHYQKDGRIMDGRLYALIR